MKPEKKRTKNPGDTAIRLNDIGFRLIFIPFFGIAIPLLTHVTAASDLTHWQLKLSYSYTIFIAFVIWQGNRYLLFTLRSYFDWFNRPVRKILALILAITFFTIPVSSIMLAGWYLLFKNGQIDWQVVNTSTLIIMICVLFITHVYETVFLVKESESEIVRNEQLERAKAEAELQALKSQIDPHFMFNSLNTISCLIDERPTKAKEFNDHLADVYRYILQNRSRNLVMLQEEIAFLEDYFSLQKIRYGEAVALEIKIEESVYTQYVMPPITLQILAENAFKHNEFNIQNPLHIYVCFDRDKLVVQNKVSKKEIPRSSPKTGLHNLAERYRITTGQSIGIAADNDSFVVHLPILKID